ncbi:MAG: ABC transporter substrate-binding protein [Polyangiales bacterium]
MPSSVSLHVRLAFCLFMSVIAPPGCHPQPPLEYRPIRVLATFNLTGSDSELDQAAFNGAKLAQREINAAGGVRGRNLQLVAVDTASNPTVAVQAVKRALKTESDIVAGIGYCDSTFAGEIGALFENAGLPFISPGATDPKVPERIGDDMFFAAYGDDAQATAMAKFAYENLGVRRLAVWMDDRQDYPTTVGTYVAQAFKALGGQVQMHAESPEVLDFSAFITSVRSTTPPFDAVYGATMPAQAVAFIEQLRAAGIAVPLLSGDGWDEQPVVDASQEKNLRAIYFTTHPFLGVETNAMNTFVDAYRNDHGSAPSNAFAALGYDALGLLADAMKRAGSTEPEAVRNALASTADYEGVVGAIGYRIGSRVPIKAVSVVQVDQGRASVVWTGTP